MLDFLRVILKKSLKKLRDVRVPRCCIRDRGRLLGVGLQEQISNHLKLLWLKATVVSVEEKAYKIRQV